MSRLFYLFSESKKLEAIYLCDDEDYIDKPKLKTGVYPMGTLLSRSMDLLTPWYEENFSILKKDEIISIALKTPPKYESSFSYILNDDSVAQIVFNILIRNQEYISAKEYHNKPNHKLKEIMEYISECQKNTNKSSTELLMIKLNEIEYILPKHTIYYANKQNEKSTDKKRSTKNIFNPRTVRKSKRLFQLDEPKSGVNLFGDLRLPIYVYEIYDIFDFIIFTLQCVFEKDYILGKCQFCNSLFVAKDRRTKYCPNQLKNMKSCQELNKLNRQLIRERNSECLRIHKNIRTMLANKIDPDDIRYDYYLKKSKEYRNKVFNGKVSEEEYISWMKQYWEDFKADEKEKKKINKI